MAHIFWEKKEIPIPEKTYINHSDGRVFIFVKEGKVLSESKRIVIGHATSEKTMHPNAAFKQLYPSLWKTYYGDEEQIKEHQLSPGMYATTLSTAHRLGLYDALNDTVGPQVTNALMDLAMYSILEKSNVALTFNERMKSEVVFSKNLPNDTWLSEMYTKIITRNNRSSFLNKWIELRKQSGDTKVWISVDGTNEDCTAVKCDLAEKGKSKSRRNNNIIVIIYAVSSKNGMPLTYRVYNGGMVDSKALMEIVRYLSDHGVETEGFILDRGLCTSSVFTTLDSLHYPYIVMLKNDTYSHVRMYEDYSEIIKWKVDYIVNQDAVFGISSKTKQRIFKKENGEAFINLFYDGANGSDRAITLIRKVMMAVAVLRQKIADGENPEVPDKMSKYIEIKATENGTEVNLRRKDWQEDIDRKGFYSIASDKSYGAEFVHRHYHLRDVSEKGYSEIKTQLGYEVPRNHTTEAIENKLFACMVSSIVRTEIVEACKAIGVPTNQMIRELDRIHMFLGQSDVYIPIHNESDRQKAFLKYFSIIPNDFDDVAEDVNGRTSPISSQYRKLARFEKERIEKEKALQKQSAEQTPKRKRGRPKGSISSSKETESNEPTEQKPKGKPGRPKGSKNKNRHDRKEKSTSVNVEKRKPGRPKGSRNKANLELMQNHRIGRPPGSKNKPK